MTGGEERERASNIYRQVLQLAFLVYGPDSRELGKLQREYAQQLEERHQERGRPENSRWNKSAAIEDDAFSKEARLLLKEALAQYPEMSTEAASIKMSQARLCKAALQGAPGND
jgi:hypothetical protein